MIQRNFPYQSSNITLNFLQPEQMKCQKGLNLYESQIARLHCVYDLSQIDVNLRINI